MMFKGIRGMGKVQGKLQGNVTHLRIAPSCQSGLRSLPVADQSPDPQRGGKSCRKKKKRWKFKLSHINAELQEKVSLVTDCCDAVRPAFSSLKNSILHIITD